MKIGFILECSTKGPDADIYPYLAKVFCQKIELESPATTFTNKKNLLLEGASAVEILFKAKCDYVFIIWDRLPKFVGGSGKCADDFTSMEKALDNLKLDKTKVIMCCITDMLESWMIADGSVITDYFKQFTNHKLDKFPDYKSETEQMKPEEKLSRYNNKYNKYTDNFKIVKTIKDFNKIAKRNNSFKHFKDSIEGICK